MLLYHRHQVYELDRLAIQNDLQPGHQLMGKAALVTWQSIQLRWPHLNKIVVFAGSGNNGGDAYAVAALAQQCGCEVKVFSMGDQSRQTDESRFYRKKWEQNGGKTQPWHEQDYVAEIIIDGLLGIGINKELDENWCSLIKGINAKKAIRVSIDIPSGLNADTGNAMPCAIQADLTVSFVGRKIGCYLADGPDYCGEMIFDNLGLSQSTAEAVDSISTVLDESSIGLPTTRHKNSHKNQFGHVLVIGAGPGMSGAARLAGLAALRCGAGLVSLCVHAENYVAATCQHAELMVSCWDNLPAQLEKASVIIIGPGLGRSKTSLEILKQLHGIDKPMVIDADALEAKFVSSLKTNVAVLTPHPGEMARLLGFTSQEVQQDRVEALQNANLRWPYVTVLKGSGTLISSNNQKMALCRHGHAGMASAGMGDVLAGMIGGYLAQGLSSFQAASSAVLIHALAAEHYATQFDPDGLIASDIIQRIGSVVKNIRLKQSSL